MSPHELDQVVVSSNEANYEIVPEIRLDDLSHIVRKCPHVRHGGSKSSVVGEIGAQDVTRR